MLVTVSHKSGGDVITMSPATLRGLLMMAKLAKKMCRHFHIGENRREKF
jgi:hypothetical protein